MFEFLRPLPLQRPAPRLRRLRLRTIIRITCPGQSKSKTTVNIRPSPPKSLSEQLHSINWLQREHLVELAYAPTHKVTRRRGANRDGGMFISRTIGVFSLYPAE